MPERSSASGHHPAAESAAKRKKRTPSAQRRMLRRAIERAARDRQAAWLATQQAERTEALTRELTSLFEDVRIDEAGVPR